MKADDDLLIRNSIPVRTFCCERRFSTWIMLVLRICVFLYSLGPRAAISETRMFQFADDGELSVLKTFKRSTNNSRHTGRIYFEISSSCIC